MFTITDVFTLEATRQNNQYTVVARKNDTRTREIRVAITSSAKTVSLAGCSAIINAKKPDDTVVYADCEISGNYIICTIPSSMLAVGGRVECELVVYDNSSNQLTSPRFEIIVEDTLYDEDAIESEDDYTALISALAEANKLTNISIVVETLQPNEAATASAVITADGVEFTFGIPKGEKGDKGAAGEGAGDMHTSVYDTEGRETDIFEYIDDHIDDKNNPHGVTAVQVGADASGSAAAVASLLTAHETDTNNPHRVTAAQIGAALSSTTVNGNALSTNIVLTAEDLEALEKTGETLWSGDVTSSTTLSLTSAYTEYTLIIVEWGMVGLSNAKKHDVFYVPSISGTMCVTGNDASATLTFSGTSVTVGVISGVRLYKVIGIK